MGLPTPGWRHLTRAAVAATLAWTLPRSDAAAQDRGTVIAGGLNRPMGVLVTPDGSVWVVDAGTGGAEEVPLHDPIARRPATATFGETSRVIRVTPDGRQTVIATLPSLSIGEDQVYGGDRLAMLNGALYATVGGWGEHNPGERRPLLSAVVRIDGNRGAEVVNTWDLEGDRNPDGTLRESNPFGLTAGPDGRLWVADAAGNTLLRVDPGTGTLEVAAIFDGVESPLPNPNRGGAMESDPVPTAVAFDGEGNAYVSLLPGLPFLPGSARVMKVTPRGEISEFATGLTMLTDLRRGPDGNLYAVTHGRFTEQGPLPNSGAIVRVREGAASEVVVDGLSFPTSLDFNAVGDAFVATNGAGPAGAGEVRRFAAVAAPR